MVKDMLDNHHALQKLCKEMDPTRPTTLACFAMCSPFHTVTKISDIVAWNLYLGWYVPGLFLNDLFMKFYHWKYPKRCLGYSEYGAEGMPNLHSARPKRGDHTEEYQAKYHEYMLECFERHSFLWSTYVWNMFDFATDARNQGGEPGMNHKGLVTFDRRIKKDSFYIYKAWWSEEPFVHLCGKRYEYRAEKVTNVTVYSNQNEVSLYNNGKLVETKTGTHAFHFQVTMKADGTVQKIIVLINSANPLQVDFLKNNEYAIDACLWIGDVGISGVNAVAEILAGNVTPSGSLVDTYCYDNFSSPAMANFVPTTYGGYTEGIIPANASTYMIYQEGIYVGYKYYETRYEDYVMGTGNAGNYAYRDDIAFPFGHGLSYTSFEYSNVNMVYNEATDQFEVTVTITNTGDTYSGKETVQVYAQAPYTAYDVEHGVEKVSVALCGFAKTDILAPGTSETITVYVDKRDFASYDTYGAGTYILDDGDYYLAVATDAHNVVNNVLAAKGYTVANTDGRMDVDGNAELVCQWNNPSFDATTYATSKNGTEITNQLSNADLNLYEGNDTSVIYVTRNDWSGTFPSQIVQIALTDQMVEDLQDIQYDPADYEAMEMPTLGAKNGLKLYDMIGLDYDDPKWELLLDQMEFDEMVTLIGDAFHWTMPVKSIEAPGTNIHRTPYGGRNFEYYSEDGFLSGKMSAYEVAAIQAKGVHVVMKHFALNDSEQDRIGLGVWLNEQAAREIYLKAYQAAFEEGTACSTCLIYQNCIDLLCRCTGIAGYLESG